MAIWPELSIFLLVLSFNLLGDGLRERSTRDTSGSVIERRVVVPVESDVSIAGIDSSLE